MKNYIALLLLCTIPFNQFLDHEFAIFVIPAVLIMPYWIILLIDKFKK